MRSIESIDPVKWTRMGLCGDMDYRDGYRYRVVERDVVNEEESMHLAKSLPRAVWLAFRLWVAVPIARKVIGR